MNKNKGYTGPLMIALAAVATVVLFAPSQTRAADLKQLAEQLVNMNASGNPAMERYGRTGRNPQTGKEVRKGGMNPVHPAQVGGIREGGRTVGAGQASAIAIKEEGANVKKEKGVEDVE